MSRSVTFTGPESEKILAAATHWREVIRCVTLQTSMAALDIYGRSRPWDELNDGRAKMRFVREIVTALSPIYGGTLNGAQVTALKALIFWSEETEKIFGDQVGRHFWLEINQKLQ